MTKLKNPVNVDDHILGDASAPVTLVEYGDYQCPTCGFAYPLIKQLMKQFYGELRFVFRNFPLQEVHPYSMTAALAAEAAALQNKFWEMHDIIYENQKDIDENSLIHYADILDLNLPQFNSDWRSQNLIFKIEKDIENGIRSGVNGTPTFFINGNRLDSYYDSYESLEYAVKNALDGIM
jgi:protein-disulfide isomerase